MKKRGWVLFLVLFSVMTLFLIASVTASIDDEIQKLTHYAESYETGNINYVQLLTYIGSARQKLNEELGAIDEEGGLLKQEQIEAILGEPSEETKWVWVENEEREKKLEEPVPIWKKIIFDGKKIQIRLNAWPSIYSRKHRDYELEDEEERKREEEWEERLEEYEGKLIYRLHFEIEFKKPEEQLDISGKINEIKVLAENFNSDPSPENAEILAKESVNAERTFENYFREKEGKCEDIMKAVFGAENQRETQKLIVHEIEFYEGENFEAIARLELCEDCEWNWIGFDIWIEGRGPGFRPEEGGMENIPYDRFENYDSLELRQELVATLDEIKLALDNRDFRKVNSLKARIHAINEAWNRLSNDIWREIEEIFEEKREMLSEEQLNVFHENYGWLKEEQERRALEKELRRKNYEERKEFYLSLFESYERREFYFEQVGFEKRLVEVFREHGEEICDNNQDDNDNEQVDCDEDQCGGKICGWTEIEIIEVVEETETTEENETEETTTSTITGQAIDNSEEAEETETTEETTTIKKKVPMYCINKICQLKEDIDGEEEAVCGNHVCEEGETQETCSEDCSICPEYDALECNGIVIFKGEDVNGCPLEPVCLAKPEFCEIKDDCIAPLCGIPECIENKCHVTELDKCREPECVDGEERIQSCESGEKLIVSVCIDGLWRKTGLGCIVHIPMQVCCKETGAADSINYRWLKEAECVGGDNTAREIVSEENCKLEGTCEEYCQDFASVSSPPEGCNGDLEISGTYPDCSCEWVCEEKPTVGEECTIKEDCGGKDDVCSNGNCVTIPKSTKPEEEICTTDSDCGDDSACTDDRCVDGECVYKFNEECTSEVRTVPEPEPEPEREEPEEEVVEEEVEEEVVEEEEPSPEPEPETEEPEATAGTGEIIFNFIGGLLGRMNGRLIGGIITGFQIEGEEGGGGDGECPDAGSPPEVTENCWYEETYDDAGCVSGYDYYCDEPDREGEWEEGGEWEGDYKDDSGEWEEKDRREREQHEEEQRGRCEKECARPCVEECIREACGEAMECNIDEERRGCEGNCQPEGNCVEKCMEGGDWWKEFEKKDEWKEEKGVFAAGGSCRTSQGKTDGFIWLNGWGEPFDEIQPLKQKYYSGGQADWCKEDLENLEKRRKEFEEGFNQEFVVWFFEDYLANSAEDWEQASSGIYELYWNNVDTIMQIVHRSQCLNKEIDVSKYNLINVNYSTEYGSLHFWEEVKTVKLPEMEGEVKIITPYMKIWIFPPKEFILSEMQKAMEEHEFPGPPEDKMKRENEEGLKPEEKMAMKQDKNFMKDLRKMIDKYGGELDVVIQFIDYETGELVFNIYGEMNEEDILKMEPMLPEEVPAQDIKIEFDFEPVYEMIYEEEKARGGRIESPWWEERQERPMEKIKDVIQGIKMFFKVRSMINSAEYDPPEAKKDINKMLKNFVWAMMRAEPEGPDLEAMSEEEQGEVKGMMDEILGSKEVITGEVIRR